MEYKRKKLHLDRRENKMDKKTRIVIKELVEVSLRNKNIIIGFPGMAFVGKMTAESIIRQLGLEKITSIFPIVSPGSVSVDKGMLKPPEIAIYTKKEAPVAVLTAPFQPHSEEGQNEVAHAILEYFADKDAQTIIAAAAYVNPRPSIPRKVYVAATNDQLLQKLSKFGTIEMQGGISGLNGLIPGLAPIYGMEGAVLLGETGEIYVAGGIVDYRSVMELLRIIGELINHQFDLQELQKNAEEVERQIKMAFTPEKPEKEEERPATYM